MYFGIYTLETKIQSWWRSLVFGFRFDLQILLKRRLRANSDTDRGDRQSLAMSLKLRSMTAPVGFQNPSFLVHKILKAFEKLSPSHVSTTRNPASWLLFPLRTLNPKPQILNPKPQTLNPKTPQTPKPRN